MDVVPDQSLDGQTWVRSNESVPLLETQPTAQPAVLQQQRHFEEANYGNMHAVALRLSQFSPDAICGITPIETMLEIQDFDNSRPSDARTPDKLAQAAELSEQLQRGLAKLSPELREAVILRDLQGLDYSEIRTVLQVPEGTVKSRINRGRIELARVLEEMGVRPA